ncbi:MAG: TlpA disulfide reductase family protein [Candidatus Cloacimonadales bacterium]|jgi:thiol-disulfide isomerase/thioredoxin|nr:TlpA family protein disulfide reductase [Candidatus Cloacimonadota bacterium]MDX9976550.1 TlpA disulfide reductase family protein [Candidatus Cloacimonadales bacterium]
MKRIMITVMILLVSLTLFAQTKKIQNFSFEDINGKKINTAELLKKGPIVLDFWATFCAPCMKSLPAYNKLAIEYPNITFIAVSSDSPRAKDKVIKTVRSLKLDMITTIDANKSIQKSFNVKEIPETFVINQEGEITFHHNGYIPGDEDKLEEELKKLLKGSK